MLRPNPKRLILGTTDAIKAYLGDILVWPDDTCVMPMNFMNNMITNELDTSNNNSFVNNSPINNNSAIDPLGYS
jgi:hypothetical protein